MSTAQAERKSRPQKNAIDPSKLPTVRWECFKPDEARRILEQSGVDTSTWRSRPGAVNPREFRLRYAEKIARDLAGGLWDFNGETIKFNEAGELIDGQTRLAACVISGCILWSIVVRGVTDAKNVDVGNARSFPQILKAQGYANADVLAGLVAFAAASLRGELATPLSRGRSLYTVGELLKVMGFYDTWTDWVKLGAKGPLPRFLVGTAFVASDGVVNEIAEHFICRMRDGKNLRSDDPVFALRERMQENRGETWRARNRRGQVALITLAWNALAVGSPMGKNELRYKGSGPGRQTYPEIVLLSDVGRMPKKPR